MRQLMKYALIAVLALLPTSSFASGKLAFQPGYYLNQREFGYNVGLSVYQALDSHKQFFINSWTGMGDQPWDFKDNTLWMSQKATVETFFGNLGVGAGLQVNYSLTDHYFNNNVHMKLSYQLW